MIDMNRDNQRGFSLIEILIAITVFAIGILAVGIGLSYTDPLNFDNDDDGTDQDLDNDGDDDSGNNFGLDDANATVADHNDPNNPVDGRYNIFWNIATDHPMNNIKEIGVIITWTDKGAPKKVSITSMKADII
jgi:type IV pilus assembly protein PilV